jgi:hypothetical protein
MTKKELLKRIMDHFENREIIKRLVEYMDNDIRKFKKSQNKKVTESQNSEIAKSEIAK